MTGLQARTTIAQVEASARAAGVYLATLCDVFEGVGEAVPAVVVQAHDGPWFVYLDPTSILGWVAEQTAEQDGEYRPAIPYKAGWLGARDLEPERIIANLLVAEDLPADLWGREPSVSTRRPQPEDRP